MYCSCLNELLKGGSAMKGDIKKLTVLVIVVAMAMFIEVGMASAARKTINGTFAFTGSGACTLAPGGFNDNFTPKDAASATMGPNFWEGVYTFNHDGTGKMDAQQRYQEGPNAYGTGLVHLSWEFEYEMDGNEITFKFTPGTYYAEYLEGPNKGLILPNTAFFDKPYTGLISQDGRNLFVFFGVPMKIIIADFGLELVCNGVHQGFKTP
jgi:hypothetical protein